MHLQSQNERLKINLTNLQEQLQMRDQRMKELFKQIRTVEEELKAAREKIHLEQSAKGKAE